MKTLRHRILKGYERVTDDGLHYITIRDAEKALKDYAQQLPSQQRITATYPKVCDSCKSAGVIPEPLSGTSTTRMCPACNGSGVVMVTETLFASELSADADLPKGELYQKVYIKSEADLPKKDRDYIVHSKAHKWIGLHNWKSFENENYPEYNQYLWLLNFDWYLQPISADADEKVTDEMIERYYPINFHHEGHDQTCRREGAKAMRDGKIKPDADVRNEPKEDIK